MIHLIGLQKNGCNYDVNRYIYLVTYVKLKQDN